MIKKEAENMYFINASVERLKSHDLVKTKPRLINSLSVIYYIGAVKISIY